MKLSRRLITLLIILLPSVAFSQNHVPASAGRSQASAPGEAAGTEVTLHNFIAPGRTERLVSPVPPGTIVTLQNWQQYKDYLSDGMQAFLSGKLHWKLPADFQIVIGPTHDYSAAREYYSDTLKYSKGVRVVNRSDGGHTLDGYVAGLPFPNPTAPLKGWKLLVDMWYSYIPHLECGYDTFYLVDRFGNLAPETALQIYRKLGHASDYGIPPIDPNHPGLYYTEYLEILAPEESRYLANLTVYYMDQSKPIDTFLFIPSLRRSLRLSAAARCSPVVGTDFTEDDASDFNFNGDWQIFNSHVVREGWGMSLDEVTDYKAVGNLANYYRPAFFPKPVIGKWEMRPVWLLDVRRIPSRASGYCYGKKILWLDKQTYSPFWIDGYDSNQKLWKVFLSLVFPREVPHEGIVQPTGQWLNPVWDVQSDHLTLGMATNPEGTKFKYNEDCRNFEGQNLDDVGRYSVSSGLEEIMR
ncbi:MAG TPA: DUF1329 domain-containing protein [Candidatus Binataceae bacterium]|nr:DUF1329 domain-containing protein [Candidatus Binataceae bacterium]